MMKVVLVVGGAGYVGSHACKELARRGVMPVTFDNLSTGHAHTVKWGPFEEGSLLDSNRVASVFQTYKPDAVMHFAAHAYVGESVAEPLRYYKNNVAATIALLEAMKQFGVQNLIFSSTCAVYGIPESLPISEVCPRVPISPYGRTKFTVEMALEDCAQAYEIKYVSLRYFNAAGADPDGEIGEEHEPETHLIPRALMASFGDLPHLDIFGNRHPTPDGTCLRDYIHVSDLAVGHWLALDYLAKGGRPRPFNLGTGRATSVAEVIAAVESATGQKVPTRVVAARPGDPPALFADPAQARELLGFRPQFADIEPIVRTAADFYRAKRATL